MKYHLPFIVLLASFCIFQAKADAKNLPTEATIPFIGENGCFFIQSYGRNIVSENGISFLDANSNTAGGELVFESTAASNGEKKAVAVNEYLTIRKKVQHVGEYYLLTWDIDIKPNAPVKYLSVSLKIPNNMLNHYTFPEEGLRILPGKDCYLHTTLGGLLLDAAKSDFPWVLHDRRNDSAVRGFVLELKLRNPKFIDGLHVHQEIKTVRWPSDSSGTGYSRLFYSVPLIGNRSLHDEVAGDQQGGWFDLGNKDLHDYETPWTKVSQAVPFRPIEKAIILRGTPISWLDETSAEMPFEPGFKAERLDFLHATGWSAEDGDVVLTYEVVYADGTIETIPIRFGEEIQNWCNLEEPSNARLGWTGYNAEGTVGFFHYSWKNPHKEIALKSIRAVSANSDSVPAIIGITATDASAITPEEAKVLDDIYNERP